MTSSKSLASRAAQAAKLTDFKALTFDCYGTLIDWESGMVEALKPLTSRASRKLTRDEILEAHARHESSQQVQTPAKVYRELLATVYRRLAEEWGVATSWSDCATYGRSVRNWPAFADTAASLQYLKRHYKLAILSNVDNESFSFSSEKLGVDFDAVYTAESLFHDHAVANALGLTSCWIHRRHGQEGAGATVALAKTPSYDFRFESL